MHKIVLRTSLVALIILFFCHPLVAAEKAVVSGNMYSPPLMWKKSGQFIGVAPQLIERIFSDLKISYVLEDIGNWEEVQENARNGVVDVIVSAYKNDDRQTYLDFSAPYLSQPVVIIVKKGNPFVFDRWEDLIGKKGATHFGESYGEAFDSFMESKLDIKRAGMKRCFDLLEHDLADYIIIDYFKGENYIRMLRREGKVEFLPKPVAIGHHHIAIAKHSPLSKELPRINAKLKQLKKDGSIETLIKEANLAFDKSMKAREKLFERSKAANASAKSSSPSDRPDFHQRYMNLMGMGTATMATPR